MRLVRIAIATLVLAVMVIAGQAPAVQAAANYTGAEEICVVGGGCGTSAGVFWRNGRYYTMTVAHITTPAALGSDVYAYHPAFRYVGKLAYRSTVKDIALIDMGTVRPDPSLRIANGASFMTPPGYVIPGVTDIYSVPTGADWPYYASICTTGWSSSGGDIKTKCGWADNTIVGDQCATTVCGIRAYSGSIAGSADTGASGSPVWQPSPFGSVRLLGFISNCVQSAPCAAATFRPIYLFSTHDWAANETAPGYATGAGGFVLIGS